MQKEKVWLQANPHTQQLSSRIPESNGPSVTGFSDAHCLRAAAPRPGFSWYGGTKTLRQQKWGVYIRKQRAVEHMCRKLTGGHDKANVTVAFGSAGGPHMKGTLPAPVKLLHKALQRRAVVVNPR